MRFKIPLFVVLLWCIGQTTIAFSQSSFVDDRSVLRKRLSGDLKQLISAQLGRDFFIRVLTSEGRVSFRLRRVERPSIVRTRNSRTVSSAPYWREPLLFSGYLLNVNKVGVKSVTADIISNRLRFSFIGPRRGGAYTVVQHLRLSGGVSNKPPHISRVPTTLGAKCGAAESSFNPSLRYLVSSDFPAVPYYAHRRVIEVSTEGDYEYFLAYGRDSYAEMEATIHTANEILSRQLGLSLRIKEQHLFTSQRGPYTSTDPFLLLTQFQSYTSTTRQLGKADLYHLFSGKSLEDHVVGFSYVGQACVDASRYGYGITQRYHLPIQALITAHEIGHSLGAEHPEEVLGSGLPDSLMTGVVRAGNSIFSDFSVNQIATFVDQNGTCISSAPKR